MTSHRHNNDRATRVVIAGSTTSGADFKATMNFAVCTECFPNDPSLDQATKLVGEALNNLGGLALDVFRGNAVNNTYLQTQHLETFTVLSVTKLPDTKGAH